jgi:hypothetical protein
MGWVRRVESSGGLKGRTNLKGEYKKDVRVLL